MIGYHKDCPFYNDACHQCFMFRIEQSNLLENSIKTAWSYLYNKQVWLLERMRTTDHDARLEIIGLYVTIPSLFHESIRAIFLEYFSTHKEISKTILEEGHWFPLHLNLKSTLLEHLWLTQQIDFPYLSSYLSALDFFTMDNYTMYRNKASHCTTAALKCSSQVSHRDIFKKFCVLMRCVIAFEDYTLGPHSLFKCSQSP